ncbi:MAG: GNAT family N-acetyltransferase [Oligoflexia bacterium]|nr:GNAT family N-acetyltransferase [Oligoflexia bacterium]
MEVRKIKVVKVVEEVELKEIKEIDKEISVGSWSDQNWSSINLNANYQLFVLEDPSLDHNHNQVKSKIVGFALFLESKEERLVHLLKIAIRGELQTKGLGTKLLKSTIDYYMNEDERDGKFDKIYLEVETENKEAILLYKKFNFKTLHKCNHFYGTNIHAYKMLLTR